MICVSLESTVRNGGSLDHPSPAQRQRVQVQQYRNRNIIWGVTGHGLVWCVENCLSRGDRRRATWDEEVGTRVEIPTLPRNLSDSRTTLQLAVL